MKGADVAEVSLDCLWLNAGSQPSDPLHDRLLGCWENRPVVIGEPVEDREVDKALLAGRVGAPGGGGKAVPQVEHDQP